MDILFTLSLKNGLWSNGLQQNIIFLARLVRNLGHNPILALCHPRSEAKDMPDDITFIESKEIEDLPNVDYVLQTGWVVGSSTIDLLKQKNPRCKNIHVHYGNRLLADIEQSHWDTLCVGNHSVDEVWVSPHYSISIPYFKTYYSTQKVFTLPYIWSPTYIQKHEDIWNASGKSCYYDSTREKTIGILEPNLNMTKNCLPSIMIVEELLSQDPSLIKHVKVYCALGLAEKRYFRSLVWGLQLPAQNKISFAPRQTVTKTFSHDCSVIVSHQLLNALNYTYFEALYFNIPLVHNSDIIKSTGYYYPDYDSQKGADALRKALCDHDENLDSYKESAAKVIWRYSPENPVVIEGYKKLFV